MAPDVGHIVTLGNGIKTEQVKKIVEYATVTYTICMPYNTGDTVCSFEPADIKQAEEFKERRPRKSWEKKPY